MFGASPRWFHLKNLIWFALAVLLVHALFRRWGAPPAVALVGSLVFALHPVQVEAAGWITSRGDLLCLVFFAGALLLHSADEGISRRFLLAAGLLVLALLSKEEAVIFAGAAALADFFFRDGRDPRRTFARWPRYLFYLVLAGLYVVLWVELHRSLGSSGAHLLARWGGSLFGTFLLMARGFVYYARLVLLPVDTALDYYLPPAGFDVATVAAVAIVLVVAGWAVRRLVRGGGAGAFAVLWFLVTILPASNLVAPIGIPTAERFLLVPMVGVSLALGAALVRVLAAGRAGRALVAVALALLVVLTFDRARDWADPTSLWSATLARVESPRGLEWRAERRRLDAERRIDRARELRDRNRLEEAEAAEAESRSLLGEAFDLLGRQIAVWRRLPDGGVGPVAKAKAEIAVCRFDLGEYERALALSREALSVRPAPALGHFARALALSGLGRLMPAAQEADRAVELEDTKRFRRGAASIHAQVAREYDAEGNRALAFLALKRAWHLLPDDEENAGVFKALRQMEEDLGDLERRLRKRIAEHPGDAEPVLQLATLYARYGEYERAAPLFDGLLADLGGDPRVLFPYALYFWQGRDTDEGYRRALDLYRRIEVEAPDFPGVREQMRKCEERLGTS